MNVTLNIENDAELRAYIKDCVKGQVLSIVREEYITLIREELTRKLNGSLNSNFERMTRDALGSVVRDVLKENGLQTWNQNYIKPFVEAYVAECIKGKDWNKMVDELAKEKVRNLIK